MALVVLSIIVLLILQSLQPSILLNISDFNCVKTILQGPCTNFVNVAIFWFPQNITLHHITCCYLNDIISRFLDTVVKSTMEYEISYL